MKNLLLCFCFCVVLGSCEDDEAKTTDCPIKFSSSSSFLDNPTPPKHPCDYMTARKNGEEWTVWASTSYGYQNDTLYVHGSGIEESLSFKFVFTGPGTYELVTKANNRSLDGNAYYYTTIGGDVVTSLYHLAEKTTVEIVEYNEAEKVIKGNFEFSFIEHSTPSTLRFEQGTFSVHLPD